MELIYEIKIECENITVNVIIWGKIEKNRNKMTDISPLINSL